MMLGLKIVCVLPCLVGPLLFCNEVEELELEGGKVFGSSPVVIGVVGSSRAGNITERRIRGIPKRDGLVNWSKFMVRFKGYFLWL